MAEMYLVTAAMIRNFDFEILSSEKDIEVAGPRIDSKGLLARVKELN